MSFTTISFEIDSNTAKEAEEILSSLGLDLASYCRMSIAALIREKGIPFAEPQESMPSDEARRRFRKSLGMFSDDYADSIRPDVGRKTEKEVQEET